MLDTIRLMIIAPKNISYIKLFITIGVAEKASGSVAVNSSLLMRKAAKKLSYSGKDVIEATILATFPWSKKFI